MNEKTAKRLRKIAMGMVVAAEEKGQKIEKVGYVQDTKTGQIRVAKRTWKGAYKALKNGIRKAHLGKAWNAALATTAERQAAARAL